MPNTAMEDLREDILSSVLLSTQTKTIVCAFIDNHLEKEKEFAKGFVEWVNENCFYYDYANEHEYRKAPLVKGEWIYLYNSDDNVLMTTDQLIETYIKTLQATQKNNL